MNTEQWKKAEKDKQRAQDQIALEAMFFVVLAFILGYIVSLVPIIIPQVVFTILLGLISWALVEKRIKISMSLAMDKTEEILKQELASNQLQEGQKKYFVSLVEEELPFRIVYDDLSKDPGFRGSLNEAELKKRLTEFKKSLKCVNELLYEGRTNKGSTNEGKILKSIVIEAVEQSLSINREDRDFTESCKHLYAYLRAWLICSIRYNTKNLPIEWVQNTILDKQQQINAIEYIKDRILTDEKMRKSVRKGEGLTDEKKGYFSDDTIEETREYLGILIAKIAEVKTPEE